MSSSTGRILFWPAASLWIGSGHGRTRWHEHHAHQLALALEGDLCFRTAATGDWQRYGAAIVPSHCTHQFEVEHTRLAHLFVEPESQAGHALSRHYRHLQALPADVSAAAAGLLREALDRAPSPAALRAAGQQALALLCGGAADPPPDADPRLARALAHIRARIRGPLRLPEVAAVAALSESRFRHLFVAETGCSFRAYVLWLRLNVAVEAVVAGASWTAAAHEAGFSDSAHLSRTHQRMFGIEPTALRLDPDDG